MCMYVYVCICIIMYIYIHYVYHIYPLAIQHGRGIDNPCNACFPNEAFHFNGIFHGYVK